MQLIYLKYVQNKMYPWIDRGIGVCACTCSVAQSCLTLCNPMDCRTRLLCLWNFPGKSTGVGFHFPLQGIFPTQGLSPCLLHLLHCQVDPLPRHHLGSPMQSKKFKENKNKRKIKESLNTMKVKIGEVVLISGKVGFKGKIDYLLMFTSWKIVQ